MPMYLKRETIRLLEASIESISIAITALGLPKRIELRENTSENAIEIVLVGVAPEEPEWLETFERVAISPKEQDISFLLDTLEKSKYASLIKISKSDVGLPVVIKPEDPNAIPIEPQFLKKTFTSIRDRCGADIGNANGRLEEGTYNVPPIESVYELFAFKFERLNITKTEDQQLSAHETWPFICSSLSYSGTLGPYWYFVRKTADLGQLEAYISRAKKIGDAYLRNNYSEIKSGIDAIRKNSPLSGKTKFVQGLIDSSEKAGEKKKSLLEMIKKYYKKPKALCEVASDDLRLVVDETKPLGEFLVKLVEGKYSFSDTSHKIYWARILCEAATELEDAEGLLAVLKSQELLPAHTAARKALRMIDFLNFGPQVEIG